MASPNDPNFVGPRPSGGPPQVSVGEDVPFNEIIQNLQTEENEIKEVVENTDDIRSKIRDDVVPNLEKLISSTNVNAKAQLNAEEDRLKEEEKKTDLQMFADRFAERTSALSARSNAVVTTALGRVFGGLLEKTLILLPAALALRFAPGLQRITGGLVAIPQSLEVITGFVRASVLSLKNLSIAVLGFSRGSGVLGQTITRIAGGTVSMVRFLRNVVGIGDRIAKSIFVVSGVVTKVLRFFGTIGNFLSKLAPITTLLGGVFRVLTPLFSLLGKIFFPITVILGVVQGLSDYFKNPGGFGKFLTSIFGGILEAFTFGLLDIERLYGFFDTLSTNIKLLFLRIPGIGDRKEAARVQREFDERRAERLASRSQRENAREAVETRKAIREGFDSNQTFSARENILSQLSGDITRALGLASGGDSQGAALVDAVAGLGAIQAEAIAADAKSKSTEAVLRGQQDGQGSLTPTPPPVDPEPNYSGGWGQLSPG